MIRVAKTDVVTRVQLDVRGASLPAVLDTVRPLASTLGAFRFSVEPQNSTSADEFQVVFVTVAPSGDDEPPEWALPRVVVDLLTKLGLPRVSVVYDEFDSQPFARAMVMGAERAGGVVAGCLSCELFARLGQIPFEELPPEIAEYEAELAAPGLTATGEWRVLNEQTVYDNEMVRLDLADVRTPDGQVREYTAVHLARVAVALVTDDLDRVLMNWRYRVVPGQEGFELPNARVGAGADPVAVAADSVVACGYRPLGTPYPVLRFEALPGLVAAPVQVFRWRSAVPVGDGPAQWVPLTQVAQLAQRRELLGAGTLVPLLFLLVAGPR